VSVVLCAQAGDVVTTEHLPGLSLLLCQFLGQVAACCYRYHT